MSWDGTERRCGVTNLETTASVPTGTLLTVPSVKPQGPVPDAKIVAAPTKNWFQSAEIWIAGALPVIDLIADPLLDYLKVNSAAHRLPILALSIYLVIRRRKSNYVIK